MYTQQFRSRSGPHVLWGLSKSSKLFAKLITADDTETPALLMYFGRGSKIA